MPSPKGSQEESKEPRDSLLSSMAHINDFGAAAVLEEVLSEYCLYVEAQLFDRIPELLEAGGDGEDVSSVLDAHIQAISTLAHTRQVAKATLKADTAPKEQTPTKQKKPQ